MESVNRPNAPQTLGSIISEVIVDFPSKPYGQILAKPKLRQYLLNSVIFRLSWTYPWRDEVDAPTSKFSPEFRAQLFRIHLESAIYWGLEEIIQQNLDMPQTA